MKIKFFVVFIVLLSSNFFSQSKKEQILLTTYFVEIEQQFNVKFSYADDDVTNIWIDKPININTLEEIINYLNQKTLLQFNFIDGNFITVSFLNKTVQICGQIIDAETKIPLANCSISIVKSNKGVTSNEFGEFIIDEVPVKSQLKISFLGFASKVFDATFLMQKPCKQIVLEEISEELFEITVPFLLTQGLQKSIDGNTILNTEQFGILPGLSSPDILETLKVLPGVESATENISNINVRGGTNDQNLMIWDGIKMYHSGHFFGLISAYNPYATKSVSITKNGTKSAFSDGVSSTVLMETDNQIKNKFSGNAGFDMLSADVYAQIPINKSFEIHTSARRSITDFLETPTFSKYFSRSFQDNSVSSTKVSNSFSNFYFTDATLKLLYDINYKHSIRLNSIFIENQLNYSETFTTNSATNTENSTLKQQNIGLNFVWEAFWNSKFSSKFSSFISGYQIESADYNIDSNQYLTQLNSVLETSSQMEFNYKFSDILQVDSGINFNEIGVRNTTTVTDPSFFTTNKNVLLRTSFFNDLTLNFDKTFIRAGFRLNHFDKFNRFIFEPRVSIHHQLNSIVSMQFQGEYKNQTTAQIIDFEDNFLGIEKRRWVLANPNRIPIITSKQASLGLQLNFNDLFLELTSYYKKVDDITIANQGFYNNVQNTNATGSYTTKGIEFLINKKTQVFSTWLSYTYAFNTFDFDVFNPQNFPNSLDVRHSLNTAFSYNFNKNLSLSIGTILRTGNPYTTPVEGNETLQNGNTTIVNYNNPNNEFLPNFFRFDVSASYKFTYYKNHSCSIRLGVINITNHQNMINSYFVVDNSSNSNVKRINNYSLPFTPNLSVRFKF